MRLSELTAEQRSALAAQIRDRGRSAATPVRGIDAIRSEDEVPLTHAQLPLYVAAQTRPENPSFLVPVVLHLEGAVVVDRLRGALQSLSRCHPAALLRFRDGDPPRQSIDFALTVPLVVQQVSASHLDEVTRSACCMGFDLSEPPHQRATLLTSGPLRHRLVVVWHHLVTDGWSLDRWLNDLPAAYDGTLSASKGDTLAYARWEASAAGQTALRQNADFWAARLARLQDAPQLPFGPAALVDARPTTDVAVPIAAAQDDRLRTWARSVGATPTAALLGLFTAVWHVCADARQVPIGIPAANRSVGVADDVLSLRSELLPLVVDVDPSLSFSDVVRAARSELIDAMAHEPVPLGEPRVTRHLPDITAVLVLTSSTPKSLTLGGATATVVPVQIEGTQTPLSLLVDDGDVSLWRLVCDPTAHIDLVALATAFVNVLAAVLDAPEAPLGVLLSPAPGQAGPSQLMGGATDRPPLVAARLITVAAATPSARAVRDEFGTWIDYAGFDRAVGVLARRLSAAGVLPGDRVAVVLGRCVEHLVAVHAVWRAGACVVPLRLDDPPDRLGVLAHQACIRLVLSWDRVGGLSTLPWLHPVYEAELAEFPLPAPSTSDSAAYVVFTSGTSGTPKPVVISHGSLANELQWRIDTIGLVAADRVLQTIPLSFDPAFWQCFGPLAVGGSVVVLTTDLGVTPAHLVTVCAKLGVTVIDVVPSLLAALTDADLAALPVRVVFCGGEALPSSEAARYLSVGRGELYNVYGPSEAAIDATSYRCRADDLGDGVTPIGSPISGVSLYVVDRALRQVFQGQVGELLIGGRGVSWGYLGCPRATAEAFLPDPFDPTPGGRMYRTGDRVRVRHDGALEFHGRQDQQIKVRGHRVELEEIDAAVREATGSPRVATVVTSGPAARLIAFAEPPWMRTGPEVIVLLSRRMPRYAVPSEVVVADALPVTRNGKVDRIALAARIEQARVVSTDDDDGDVAAVRAAFRDVLDVDTVADDDDLYTLGGASLGAARVAALLRETTGRRVGVETVLAHPSVRTLSHALRDLEPAADRRSDAATPGSRWVLDLEQAIGGLAPPVCHLLVLDDEVGQHDVARAAAAIVERHVGLWARGRAAGSELCSAAALPEPPTLILDDLAWCERGIADDDPGLHVVLLGSGGRGRHVLVRLARSRADGASAVVVSRELRALLEDRSPLAPPPLWPPILRATTWEDEAYLRGLGPLRHDPWEHERPARRSWRHHGVRVPLDPALVSAVASTCRAERVVPAAIHLAAAARVVMDDRSIDGLLVGLPVDRRDSPDLQETVGRLVDLVPVPVRRGDGATEVQRALVVAMSHAAPGIRRVAQIIDPQANLRHRPAVCGIGVFTEVAVAADAVDTGPVPDHWSDLDLVVHVAPHSLLVSGSSDLMTTDSLRQVSVRLVAALAAVTRTDDTPPTGGNR